MILRFSVDAQHALGLERRIVEDFQISASDYFSDEALASPPHLARLNAVNGPGRTLIQ